MKRAERILTGKGLLVTLTLLAPTTITCSGNISPEPVAGGRGGQTATGGRTSGPGSGGNAGARPSGVGGSGGATTGSAGAVGKAGMGGSAPSAGGGSGAPSSGGGTGPATSGTGGGSSTPPAPMTIESGDEDDRFFSALPKGDAQMQALCGRGNTDPVGVALCANPRPKITGLSDLIKVIGLDKDRAIALNSHSTSLVHRFTTPINPRMLVFTFTQAEFEAGKDYGTYRNPDFKALGFARGEPFAEMVARDKKTGQLNFYLLRFKLPCHERKDCGRADLLTEETEKNWVSTTVYQDTDIRNTVFDCSQCHQPSGPSSERILRMQEINGPWTHWFGQPFGGLGPTKSGEILDDFKSAHDVDTQFGGIPIGEIGGDPARLTALVKNESLGDQPNRFEGGAIEGNGPNNDSWKRIHETALAGDAIPVPYHDTRISDPDKQKKVAQNYRDVVSGKLPKKDLMDTRDVLRDDALSDLNFVPYPGMSGTAVMKAFCQRCHNSRLDQTISRARFNVQNLDQMSRSEKDEAIRRIGLTSGDAYVMPPNRFATLSDEAKKAVISELSK